MHVLVSGANGFIASHLVAQLLAAGHRVRGTVRDATKSSSVAHLLALPGAAEHLELVSADLTQRGAFDAHVRDVDVVMHTASPYALSVTDAQRDLVDPAVLGTESMLAACAAAPSVTRVILTSSVAAITDEPDGRVLTHADWNTTSSLTRNPYYFSKVQAEQAAWAFMQSASRHFDLIAINPFLVIGPSMTDALNPSNQVLADLVNGTYPFVMSLTWGFVDVRDVALAHVRAMDTPAASGRYICAAETRTMAQVAALLRANGYADRKLPTLRMDNALGNALAWLASFTQASGVGTYLRTHLGRTVRFDSARIQHELGFRFRPVDESILETLADLKRWKHV
jgi:dihydroflavonol-4-reductase